jgi:hypothetical protein
LPDKEAILLLASLILVNLSEWPLLRSRGMTWILWVAIPVRVLMLIVLISQPNKLIIQPVKPLHKMA